MSDSSGDKKGSTLSFRIHGMDCVEEVATLKRVLATVVPEERLFFDVLNGRMDVAAELAAGVVEERVAATGMRAELWVEDGEREESWWQAHGRTALMILSGVSAASGFALTLALSGIEAALGNEGMGTDLGVPAPAIAVYSLGVLAGLWIVLPKAWYSARTFRPDMNLLMTIAVAGAIFLGEWFEAATVAFLFALSLYLESWSVGRARRAVSQLLSLAPQTVRVKTEAGEVDMEPGHVAVGATFLVHAGERIGLDGVVLDGRSEVDQASITGESVPVFKSEGDDVFAGTINGNGSLVVQSTKAASDTTLANIVRMVSDAQAERSDVEQWVERFARIYTPVVFVSAALVFLLPPLLFGGLWGDWFYRALVLLVIGCPCALVIATPVAIVSGLAASARQGVLVKGGRYMEAPARLRVVALDKTGTLTEGRPRVLAVHALDGHSNEGIVATAASIELRSEHPIAKAIVAHACTLGLTLEPAVNVDAVPGKGISGEVNGRWFWLGSHRYLEEREQESKELHCIIEEGSKDGRTVVVVGNDQHACGFITLADGVREDAKEAIRSLLAVGMERVVMLTGDNRTTAEAVAAQVGIEDVRAELLPADKVEAVAQLEQEIGPVGMIGDGINDAPALARASMGIAMGAMGSDIAVETADVALMADDLSKLAWLVAHSRRTMGIIRQNTVFALAIKAVFVVLTFAGMATLWGAIAADMGASLLVAANALRLLRG